MYVVSFHTPPVYLLFPFPFSVPVCVLFFPMFPFPCACSFPLFPFPCPCAFPMFPFPCLLCCFVSKGEGETKKKRERKSKCFSHGSSLCLVRDMLDQTLRRFEPQALDPAKGVLLSSVFQVRDKPAPPESPVSEVLRLLPHFLFRGRLCTLGLFRFFAGLVSFGARLFNLTLQKGTEMKINNPTKNKNTMTSHYYPKHNP